MKESKWKMDTDVENFISCLLLNNDVVAENCLRLAERNCDLYKSVGEETLKNRYINL